MRLPLALAVALPCAALAAPQTIGPDDAYLRAASPDFWAFAPRMAPSEPALVGLLYAALNGLSGRAAETISEQALRMALTGTTPEEALRGPLAAFAKLDLLPLPQTLPELRAALAANETNPRDVLLALPATGAPGLLVTFDPAQDRVIRLSATPGTDEAAWLSLPELLAALAGGQVWRLSAP